MPVNNKEIAMTLKAFQHPFRYQILASLYTLEKATVKEIADHALAGEQSMRQHATNLYMSKILNRDLNEDGVYVYWIENNLVMDVLETVEWYALGKEQESGAVNQQG